MSSMEKAQAAYDNREPEDDGGRSDFIEEQVALLMEGEDARDVCQDDYLEALDEALADGECGSSAEVILALMNKEFSFAVNRANKMAESFEKIAIRLVENSLERSK